MSPIRWINNSTKSLMILAIRAYQSGIAPIIRPNCRFQPTCSEYFIQSLRKKGVFLGSLYGIWRILRCNPFGGKGYDPVE
ncbi:MAG: membrane protein insertion efficiency factor YidD [Candidatus Brocadiia bacterium]